MFSRNEITSDAAPSRVHYPWWELEEYLPDGGMWATPSAADIPRFVKATEALMLDAAAFAEAMRRATREWPKSTAICLTTPGMNHRAWLGHAGCYLATGSPEETTRLGWHELDDAEQWGANDAADRVISEWRAANTPAQLGLWDA